MPRASKAKQSRIKNLGSRAQKQYSVTIEDVEDIPEPVSSNLECEDAFIINEKDGSLTLVGFLEDFEDDLLSDVNSSSDSESDEEDDRVVIHNYSEIQLLSDLEQFAKILAEAQQTAVKAEDERLKDNSRPKHYLKNSARSKRRYNRIRKDLEKQGYLSVKAWFAKAKVPEGCRGGEVTEDQISEAETIEDNVSTAESDSVSLFARVCTVD